MPLVFYSCYLSDSLIMPIPHPIPNNLFLFQHYPICIQDTLPNHTVHGLYSQLRAFLFFLTPVITLSNSNIQSNGFSISPYKLKLEKRTRWQNKTVSSNEALKKALLLNISLHLFHFNQSLFEDQNPIAPTTHRIKAKYPTYNVSQNLVQLTLPFSFPSNACEVLYVPLTRIHLIMLIPIYFLTHAIFPSKTIFCLCSHDDSFIIL